MDMNRQPESAPTPPIVPLQWTWIVQRQQTPDAKANSIWKFGFIAPDGAEVRVTFHQVGDNVEALDNQKQKQQQQAAQSAAMMGMPPSPDPTDFAPPGQPNTDSTEDATFYVTFFSNREPNSFMKWDVSLSHDDSLITWVTITHGIMDFVTKAKPANTILDDMGDGKMKMILRSVAMDVAAANPEYALEQTQKHHYRSFFQIKKAGVQSAFQANVEGTPKEGETMQPGQAQKPTTDQPDDTTVGDAVQQPPEQSDAFQTPGSQGLGNKNGDHVVQNNPPSDDGASKDSQTPGETPAFPSHENTPIKQTPVPKKGLSVEIGMHDYSIAVKDKDGNAVDRYRGKSPSDILRWINEKGYGSNPMSIVQREMPSYVAKPKVIVTRTPATDSTVKPVTGSTAVTQEEVDKVIGEFIIEGNSVKMMKIIPASQAAQMNTIINATEVKCTTEAVEFVFETDKDMSFKRALVELAFNESLNYGTHHFESSIRDRIRKDKGFDLKSRGKGVNHYEHPTTGEKMTHHYPVDTDGHVVDSPAKHSLTHTDKAGKTIHSVHDANPVYINNYLKDGIKYNKNGGYKK